MRIVALLTVRNEELHLARCLKHLQHEGIETCLIDNGSTDRTLEIAQQFIGHGVVRIERIPYTGAFDLEAILKNEERLAQEIDADWFIHHDADEIRQAPSPYSTLREAIAAVDAQGYNAINFDEFVFLPTQRNEAFEQTDYVQTMRYYYFFEPYPIRRVNAWKKNQALNLHRSGGHHVEFADQKIFPSSFILRHYIVLSRAHALRKYAGCVYAKTQLDQGQSLKRAAFSPDKLCFPTKDRLKEISNHQEWDRSDPWKEHEFINPVGANADCSADYIRRGFPWNISANANTTNLTYDITSPGWAMPIIVGAPRSGTTLLRLMLDAHPDLAIPPETHFIPTLQHLDSKQPQREAFYHRLVTDIRWQDFHLSNQEFYDALMEIEPFTLSAGLRCFYRLYTARLGKQRWGDKTPPYVLSLQQIQTLLPEAHFIHIIRDGRDAALSLQNLWWGPGHDPEAQAARWLWRIREGRQQGQYCAHYLEVRYEELITNTTKVLQTICDFIQLPYHPNMEGYYQSAGDRLDEFTDIREGGILRTKSARLALFQRTASPPDPTRIGRWRSEMSATDRAKFEAVAGPMLRDLGYIPPYQAMELKPLRWQSLCPSSTHLQAIKADLERSRIWLQQVQMHLNPSSYSCLAK